MLIIQSVVWVFYIDIRLNHIVLIPLFFFRKKITWTRPVPIQLSMWKKNTTSYILSGVYAYPQIPIPGKHLNQATGKLSTIVSVITSHRKELL